METSICTINLQKSPEISEFHHESVPSAIMPRKDPNGNHVVQRCLEVWGLVENSFEIWWNDVECMEAKEFDIDMMGVSLY